MWLSSHLQHAILAESLANSQSNLYRFTQLLMLYQPGLHYLHRLGHAWGSHSSMHSFKSISLPFFHALLVPTAVCMCSVQSWAGGPCRQPAARSFRTQPHLQLPHSFRCHRRSDSPGLPAVTLPRCQPPGPASHGSGTGRLQCQREPDALEPCQHVSAAGSFSPGRSPRPRRAAGKLQLHRGCVSGVRTLSPVTPCQLLSAHTMSPGVCCCPLSAGCCTCS